MAGVNQPVTMVAQKISPCSIQFCSPPLAGVARADEIRLATAESTRCVDDANGLGHIFQNAADAHVVSQIQEITLEIQIDSGNRFIGVAPFPTSAPPWSQASGPL